MIEERILRYTDLAAVIQMAKARGWPTARIVREMSSGLPHSEAMKLARKAAPLLDMSAAEFMRLRKNEWLSRLIQLREQTLTVTVFTEFLSIHPAFLLKHILLERSQQVTRSVIQQCCLRFNMAFDCR